MSAFTARIPTRWGDQDPLRHVNNAVYFTYCEQARITWMEGVEGAWSETAGPVVAEIGLAFRKPVVHPETVLVTLHVERVGGSSVTLRHVLSTEADPETVYAEGQATLVWVDYRSGRPTPLPEALREALETA